MSRTNLPGSKEILALAEIRADFCVSVYLRTLPQKSRSGACRIEFSGMLDTAARYIEDVGGGEQAAQSLVNNLGKAAECDVFFENSTRGLALFATSETALAYRLPSTPPDRVDVSDRFYLTPLMRSVFFRQWAEAQILELHALLEGLQREGRVTTDFANIAPAATNGLVSLALINFDADITGHINTSGRLYRSNAPGSYGVAAEIARRTLKNGGRVIAVHEKDMFGGTGIAVILRRPMASANSTANGKPPALPGHAKEPAVFTPDFMPGFISEA